MTPVEKLKSIAAEIEEQSCYSGWQEIASKVRAVAAELESTAPALVIEGVCDIGPDGQVKFGDTWLDEKLKRGGRYRAVITEGV